ncbi:MAG: lactate utilization protein [Candidatus Pacebacteria bacterium]|nr:lactate utilization protein [Candidatus Paceibacterota bacterium]
MDYTKLAGQETIAKTIEALAANNFEGIAVSSKEEALKKIKELIPQGASVMNGSSRTLDEIGFTEYLKEGAHGWNNLHVGILAEQDQAKQGELRRQSSLSDYYLGSAHAVSETGELVFASNTGSQLPHLAFTSPNIILVVGAQKVTPTLADALTRVQEYVVPLENERAQTAYGSNTVYAKTLILHKENPMMGRKVRIIFVSEALGF